MGFLLVMLYDFQPTQGETSSTLTQPPVAVKLTVRDSKLG